MAEGTSRTRASTASVAASEDTTPETPKAAAAAVAEDLPEEAPVFPQERLIEEADAFGFGQPSWVVAGALHTISKKNLTTDEVKAAIKAFLATEVS